MRIEMRQHFARDVAPSARDLVLEHGRHCGVQGAVAILLPEPIEHAKPRRSKGARGLPPGTTLDDLKRAGHFGLVGMVERAASIGARIRIGKGRAAKGTEVRLELPVAALAAGPHAPQLN